MRQCIYVSLVLLVLLLLAGCPGDNNNAPPVANNDQATTNQNTPVTIDVLANDSDPDGDPLTVVIVQPPAQGGAVQVNNTTGAVQYTPAANFTGQDFFTYRVTDSNNATSSDATVLILVNAVDMDFLAFVQRLALNDNEEITNRLDPEPINDIVFAGQFDDTGDPQTLP